MGGKLSKSLATQISPLLRKSQNAQILDAMPMFGLEPFVIRYNDDWELKLEELRVRLAQAPASTGGT